MASCSRPLPSRLTRFIIIFVYLLAVAPTQGWGAPQPRGASFPGYRDDHDDDRECMTNGGRSDGEATMRGSTVAAHGGEDLPFAGAASGTAAVVQPNLRSTSTVVDGCVAWDGDISAGRGRGRDSRSLWPPPLLGGCPALQLYPSADAACLGCSWRKRRRSVVAPPGAVAAQAKGRNVSRDFVDGGAAAPAQILWPLQMSTLGRCPLPEGGWPTGIRATWRWRVVSGGVAGESNRRSCSRRQFAGLDSGPCMLHAQPTGRARQGALADAPRLLQTGPYGRGPLDEGGWPFWNRAVRGAEAEGVPARAGLGWLEFTLASKGNRGNVSSSTSSTTRGRRRLGRPTNAAVGRNNVVMYIFGLVGSISRLQHEMDWATAVEALAGLLATMHILATVGAATIAAARRNGGDVSNGPTRSTAPRCRGRARVAGAGRLPGPRLGCRIAFAAVFVGGSRRRGKCQGRRRDRNLSDGRWGLVLSEPTLSSPLWRPWTRGPASQLRIEDISNGCSPTARESVSAQVQDSGTSVGTTTGRSSAANGAARPRGRLSRGAPRARIGLLRGRSAIAFLTLAAVLSRVGEAASTGQPHAEPRSEPIAAEWIDMQGRSAASYPKPHRDGFRDVASPGFQEGVRERAADGAEDFRLVAETVNSTGWGPLQRRLRSTEAHIVCAQETWVLPGQVKSSSDWAFRHGWESVWAPARLGVGGGASGGVTIFARRGMGLRFPNEGPHILEEARAVAAMCDPPGHRQLLICSAYLVDGQGVGDVNRNILGRIARAVEEQGGSCLSLIGGDFQSPPAAVHGTNFPDQIGGRILAAASARGTFRTSSASSTLDYFVAGGGLADVVDRIHTVETSGIKGHVPIQVAFLPRPVALRALTVRQPPPLALERIVGPVPAPPNWAVPRAAADKALEVAEGGATDELVQRAIDDAYRHWCQLAEREVAEATGQFPSKWGLRGCPPNVKWASVLPEVAAKGAPSEAAIATWLRGAVVELGRVVAALAEGSAQGLFDDDARGRSYMPHGATFAPPVRGGYGVEPVMGRGSRRGGRPRPPVDIESCANIVDDIRADLGSEDGRVTDQEELVDLWGRAVAVAARAKSATDACRRWALHDDTDLAADVKKLADDLVKVERAHEELRDRTSGKQWKEWLEADWQQGAKRAHAYTRVPNGWAPTVVAAESGVQSAAPTAILDHMRSKYSKLWEASHQPKAYRWKGRCEALPLLTPEQLRDASSSFARQTAVTYDGWHVRQISLVSDEGLRALAVLLAAVEAAGKWPSQTALVTMPLIGKPRGGYRGIGKMPALYRIWSKARRPEAVAWEAKHERPFFAASAGAGPIDAVYRQAMRQEAAVASGGAAAVILEDLEAFYESIDRERLLDEARKRDFPVAIVRACLAAYAAPRMITMDKMAARELYPRRGVIAGCSFATTLVKLFYLSSLDKVAASLPSGTNVDMYIDDIAVTAEGPKQEVVAKVVEAHAAIREAMTNELGCTLAAHKAAIIASSKEVGRQVAARLGQGDALVDAAPNLGTDTTAGKKRRCLKAASKKGGRFRAGMARGRRLWTVARTVGRKALQVFTAGIGPGMAYGAEVWGMADAETIRFRRVAAAALRPHSKCRSLTMAHLLAGMPTAKEEARAATQFAKTVWRANTCREYAAARGGSLADIRRLWDEAYADISQQVDMYIDSRSTNGGRASPQVARRAWASVRGPIGAAAMTLARIGWRMTSAFTWQDAHGDEVNLITTSPALVTRMIVDATRDAAELRMGALWANRDASLQGKRVCPDLAMRAIASRGGGRLTALQTAAFRAAACDGVYTRRRAVENGYDVEDVCAKCGAVGDTVHHRVYACPCTRAAVLQVVPQWFYREGGRASPSSRFWSTGIFPHPADDWPRPAAGFEGVVIGSAAGEEGLPEWHDAERGFGGHLYSDGSCDHGVIRGLARAGCAVGQVDDSGERVRAIYLPIPRHLPQTSQSGEFVGVAVARRQAARAADVKCDCANVVRAANAPLRAALGPGRMYAGIVLDRYTRSDEVANATTVSWVKAHRAEKDGDDADTRRDIRGNALADALAGEAVLLHPQPSAAQRANLEFFARRAPLVARAVGTALALFPAAEESRMHRRPRAQNAQQAKERQQHLWAFEVGRWRCSLCGTWSTSDALPRKLEASQCPGHIADTSAEKWSSLGHVVSRVQGTTPFAFCRRCGAWGSRRSRNLSKPCGAPTPAGTLALQRIAKGSHPWQGRLAGGRLAPRTRVAVVAAFDRSLGKWRGTVGSGWTTAATKRGIGRDSRGRAGGTAVHAVVHEGGAAVDELPPEVPPGGPGFDEQEEDDPFGHGGLLTQEEPAGGGRAGGVAGLFSRGGITSGRRTDGAAERLEAVRRRVMERISASLSTSGDLVGHWKHGDKGDDPSVRGGLLNQEEAASSGCASRAGLDVSWGADASRRRDDDAANVRGEVCRQAMGRSSASVNDTAPGNVAGSNNGTMAAGGSAPIRQVVAAGGEAAGATDCIAEAETPFDEKHAYKTARAVCAKDDNSTCGASEGLGGSRAVGATVAAALDLRDGVAATVAAARGAVHLHPHVMTASPPNGAAAPLEGSRTGAQVVRPGCTSLLDRPTNLGAGPSILRPVEVPGEGDGLPGESEVVGVPRCPTPRRRQPWGGARVASPGVGKEPQRGLPLSTRDARSECDECIRGDGDRGEDVASARPDFAAEGLAAEEVVAGGDEGHVAADRALDSDGELRARGGELADGAPTDAPLKRGPSPLDRIEAARDRIKRRTDRATSDGDGGAPAIPAYQAGQPRGDSQRPPSLSRLRAQAPHSVAGHSHDAEEGQDSGGGGRLRADQSAVGDIAILYRHLHPSRHRGVPGRHADAQGNTTHGSLRGAVDPWGASSQCSHDPPTIPPLCPPTDGGGGGLVTLDSGTPLGCTSWSLQALRRRADHVECGQLRGRPSASDDGNGGGGGAVQQAEGRPRQDADGPAARAPRECHRPIHAEPHKDAGAHGAALRQGRMPPGEGGPQTREELIRGLRADPSNCKRRAREDHRLHHLPHLHADGGLDGRRDELGDADADGFRDGRLDGVCAGQVPRYGLVRRAPHGGDPAEWAAPRSREPVGPNDGGHLRGQPRLRHDEGLDEAQEVHERDDDRRRLEDHHHRRRLGSDRIVGGRVHPEPGGAAPQCSGAAAEGPQDSGPSSAAPRNRGQLVRMLAAAGAASREGGLQRGRRDAHRGPEPAPAARPRRDGHMNPVHLQDQLRRGHGQRADDRRLHGSGHREGHKHGGGHVRADGHGRISACRDGARDRRWTSDDDKDAADRQAEGVHRVGGERGGHELRPHSRGAQGPLRDEGERERALWQQDQGGRHAQRIAAVAIDGARDDESAGHGGHGARRRSCDRLPPERKRNGDGCDTVTKKRRVTSQRRAESVTSDGTSDAASDDHATGHQRCNRMRTEHQRAAKFDAERIFQVGEPHARHDQVLTHHHHPGHAWHSVPEDNRHYHHARHKSSARQLRPSHHEAGLESADAHHIWRGYYGGRDSPPAIPCKPNLAAHGLEESR